MPDGNSNMPSHVLLVGTLETGFRAYAVDGPNADTTGVDMALHEAWQIVPLEVVGAPTPAPVP